MLRYIIGISLISIGVIIIRAISSGKILKKHQYAIWLIIPLCMILLPFVKINIPAVSGTPDTKISSEEVPADMSKWDIPEYVIVDGEKMKTVEFDKTTSLVWVDLNLRKNALVQVRQATAIQL